MGAVTSGYHIPFEQILPTSLTILRHKKIRRSISCGLSDKRNDRQIPNFLRISFGMAFLLTITEIVLYSKNGREKYQNPS